MKKSLSVILILFLLFNSAGYVLLYFQLKYIFKNDSYSKIKENLKEEETTEIIISKDIYENGNDDFYFVEPNEFIYHGNMYDVSSVSIDGDKVKISCYKDDKETNLNELFAQYFTNSISDKTSKVNTLLNSIIFDAGLPISFNEPSSWREDESFYFIFVPIINNFLDIPTPPPKNFS